MTALLKVSGLIAAYGEAQALFGIDLVVERGEAVALLGRNGAGKSTTFKAIMGLVDRSAAELDFAGTSIVNERADLIAQAGVGYVPETRRVFAGLSVRENLEVGKKPASAGAPNFDQQAVLALFPALEKLLDRPAQSTSGGEQQMLAIARTLMGQPQLLLLDEPSEGLAPVVLQDLAGAVAALRTAGLSILVSEQNLGFASSVAERAIVIERGRNVFDGSLKSLLADDDARRNWLAV